MPTLLAVVHSVKLLKAHLGAQSKSIQQLAEPCIKLMPVKVFHQQTRIGFDQVIVIFCIWLLAVYRWSLKPEQRINGRGVIARPRVTAKRVSGHQLKTGDSWKPVLKSVQQGHDTAWPGY